jgi:uncharacterized membrane protein (GlpM family)
VLLYFNIIFVNCQLGCGCMKIALLIIIPFIIYKIFMYWLKNKYDIKLNKMGSMMIFTIIDILIFILFDYLGT